MSLSYKTPGLIVTDHSFTVPLDHDAPQGETLEVFARELALPGGQERPFLVYLQGGPGYEAPRPVASPPSGWLGRALQDYRVLLLDQRGTGRSTPVGALPGRSAQQQADYLKHFRADAIVRDAELIRQALGAERWSILGQSFGGFCSLHYLSAFPESLEAALITGGLPPIDRPVEEVYAATYRRVLERNRTFYARYPQARARVRALLERLESEDVRLPSGDRLTARMFRQLGMGLGMSDGLEKLHYLLDFPPDSPAFLHDVQASLPFPRNPLYAIVHEACYADGGVTGWAAQRTLPAEFEEDPTLFTGEMVYPWMFEDYAALAPLREAAEILARHPWRRLYDAEVLARNTVPAAAAIYANDMYVEREFSEQTAAQVRGLQVWLTNEYEHNGLRADGPRIVSRLIDLAHGRV
ncbi:pimeloyl-ACP methyl ester carboxylesterase [Deinobacterium chartae]|uniref:Pimeloyl-ACP methyl ester carboxylesterase n=1 Tax=Deinobacterium chartae TaxID=521158 RepID=A0A841I472_9DEIO|nr:alpha/beta fold hydrolase [Deinobacterium chartae]MBB6100123.1 pimeloyl-ACP methyl ester carboxylesterase [Deinobacterium chartae]